MSKVILISPPYMKLSYPTYKIPHALTKGCDYMNPGLLIASSVLDSQQISNRIVKINNPEDELEIIQSIDDDTIFVAISCTCAWEYLETLKIAELIKKNNKDIKIAISGWQIKSVKEQVFCDSSAIDYLILGDAEYTIANLYKKVKNKLNNPIYSVVERNKPITTEVQKYPNIDFCVLDFSKFPNYEKYLPFVEESRNCPYSCNFCLNSCVIDRYQNVPFEIFKENVERIEQIYGSDTNSNLLAANFGVNYKETKRKIDYLKTKKIKWNIELHVDNHWEEYVDDLKEAGITKVSIGFESGSPSILKLMNKTQNPKEYLNRLKLLLERLNAQQIKPSLNLLIDYRENKETLTETLAFLQENKKKIKKVKANFMFAFGSILDRIDYSSNPNIIIDDYGKKIHAFPVLPKNINIEEIGIIINNLENGDFNLDLSAFTKKLNLKN